MFCCALLCVYSSFAIVLMGKRELVALLCLPDVSSLVVWRFLMAPWVCLQFVIVVIADLTHYYRVKRTAVGKKVSMIRK